MLDNSLVAAMSNQKNDIESEEERLAEELKHWVETEAEFYGRTDEDFLLLFVRGCKHDMKKAKHKLYMYYENRRKVPQWWANRDVGELKGLFQLKGLTGLPDKDAHLPTIAISKIRNSPSSDHFDDYVKVLTIYTDVILRRTNSQKNGVIVILDFTDYPFWLLQKLISPTIVYNLVHGFVTAMPFRLKALHFFNFPLVGRAAWGLIKALLPPKMKNRVFLYGSDLISLKDNIDIRLLPEEYGGTNGRLVDHEETFLEEVFSYSDYFLEDNKYGFQ